MQLKLLSWNIWYDGYFDEITRFLAASNADIIALQEVVPDDKTRDVIGYLTNLGYHHAFAPVLEIRKDGRTMSNAIFSKYEILKSETIVLSDIESRNALRADIKVGTTVIHTFTTHLLHTHQQPSEIQTLQAENLIKTLPKEHTVVMGDFNATPQSEVIKKMEEVLVNTDPSSAPTWSIYPEGCEKCRPNAMNMKLDYIFTTKDIQTSLFKVENSKGSDHLPISAKIEI